MQRMLAKGGEKPSTTEYTLQQVIFVSRTASVGKLIAQRKREAKACATASAPAPRATTWPSRLRDVTVRDLGRVAQPELPPRGRTRSLDLGRPHDAGAGD